MSLAKTRGVQGSVPSRLVVVTGASTGIGRAIAVRLANAGYHVWAGVRSSDAQRELERLGLPRLVPQILDVTDEGHIHALASRLAELAERGTKLHALVNNAALCVTAPLETIAVPTLRAHFETNVVGVNSLTQALLPQLMASGGRIVNVGSNIGRLPPPFLGAYAASKAALEALTDVWRRELASCGVAVSLVVPGPVMTPVWDKLASSADAVMNDASGDVRRRYAHPLRKFIEMSRGSAVRSRLRVEDVAQVVERCLGAHKPKACYNIGIEVKAATLLRNALPASVLDFAFRQALDLAAKEPAA
jgi:NAD(P)-dependent dehydrogenase (short-subunit alcohol dehydrogenase family)